VADKRAFYVMDVGYFDNPKIAPLVEDHPRAVILHQVCIAYGAQHLTNGRVPMRLALLHACAEQCDLDLLVHYGLLERLDERTVQVHDYLEHQRSADSVKKASDKGKQAADARWSNARSNARSMPDALPGAMPRKTDRKTTPAETRMDVERLCRKLADKIEENGSNKPQITAAWRTACRLMLDKEGRTEQQIANMIDWCQQDNFWKSNIMSMPKLREKYDQMRLKAQTATAQEEVKEWHQMR
jgi:hypothetical protein